LTPADIRMMCVGAQARAADGLGSQWIVGVHDCSVARHADSKDWALSGSGDVKIRVMNLGRENDRSDDYLLKEGRSVILTTMPPWIRHAFAGDMAERGHGRLILSPNAMSKF
jgi:hypothetical protein